MDITSEGINTCSSRRVNENQLGKIVTCNIASNIYEMDYATLRAFCVLGAATNDLNLCKITEPQSN